MTRNGIVAVVLMALFSAGSFLFYATTTRLANAQSVEANRQTAAAKQAAAIEETKNLRREIEQGVTNIWPSDSPANHRITINRLAESYRDLGLVNEYNALYLKVLVSGDTKLKRYVFQPNSFKWQTLLQNGDYQAAFDDNGTRTSKNSKLYTIVNAAISRGDLDKAERLLEYAWQSAANDEKKFRAVKQALQIGNARLAVAASLFNQKERVELALKRYRAVTQDQSKVSDEPLDQNTDWIKPKDQFGRHYIFTLASCGYNDLAEKLWVDLVSRKNPKGEDDKFFTWLTSPKSTTDFCCRLAVSGHDEQAVRLALRFNQGVLPVDVANALCLGAASNDNTKKLSQYTDLYLTLIDSLAVDLSRRARTTKRPMSEDAILLDKLASAGRHLATFIKDMSSIGKGETCKAAAELYANLASRYAVQFKKQLKAGDVHAQSAARGERYPYSLDVVVDYLTAKRLEQFYEQQRSVFVEHGKFFKENYKTNRSTPLENLVVAYAKAGHKPTDGELQNMRSGLLSLIADHLLAAGNEKEAKEVFAVAAEKAVGLRQASVVSGSLGGRVVNRTTQTRYVAVRMAAKLNDFDKAVEILDKIEFKGARIDGYRVYAETLAKYSGVEPALTWANTLEDADYRLAAQVGILGVQLKELHTDGQQSAVDQHLKRLERYGQMLMLWGC